MSLSCLIGTQKNTLTWNHVLQQVSKLKNLIERKASYSEFECFIKKEE